MAAMTLNQRQPDASAAKPVPPEVLAGSKSRSPVILALDLGQKTGGLCAPMTAPSPAERTSSGPDGSRAA